MLGSAFMLISGIQDMKEEDRVQSSEEDACKKSIKGNTNSNVSMEIYISNGVHHMYLKDCEKQMPSDLPIKLF